MTKSSEITETMENGYSSDSTQRELSNEYQHDRVKMIFVFYLLFWPFDGSKLVVEGLNCVHYLLCQVTLTVHSKLPRTLAKVNDMFNGPSMPPHTLVTTITIITKTFNQQFKGYGGCLFYTV